MSKREDPHDVMRAAAGYLTAFTDMSNGGPYRGAAEMRQRLLACADDDPPTWQAGADLREGIGRLIDNLVGMNPTLDSVKRRIMGLLEDYDLTKPSEPCSNCGRRVAGRGNGIDCTACGGKHS